MVIVALREHCFVISWSSDSIARKNAIKSRVSILLHFLNLDRHSHADIDYMHDEALDRTATLVLLEVSQAFPMAECRDLQACLQVVTY